MIPVDKRYQVPEELLYMAYGFFDEDHYEIYQTLKADGIVDEVPLLECYTETADGHIWLEQQKLKHYGIFKVLDGGKK